MKRSKANDIIQYAIDVMKKAGYPLPPFAYYEKADWEKLGEDEIELVENMLGWDITDFGSGDFDHIGLTIFTFRNGNFWAKDKYPKPYAEKYLLVNDGQILPFHYHWSKMEDIINRGGGNILIRVYNSLPDEEIDKEGDVTVHIDGEVQVVPAGTQVKLEPGMSITIMQGMYHDFEVEPGTGPVLIGEVSQCNDDNIDNRFNPPAGRFPEIEEDEPPYRLLCNEYPEAPEK